MFACSNCISSTNVLHLSTQYLQSKLHGAPERNRVENTLYSHGTESQSIILKQKLYFYAPKTRLALCLSCEVRCAALLAIWWALIALLLNVYGFIGGRLQGWGDDTMLIRPSDERSSAFCLSHWNMTVQSPAVTSFRPIQRCWSGISATAVIKNPNL